MIAAIAYGLLGAVVGTGLSRWLARRSYRYEDEQERPRRSSWWWLVPGMALAMIGVGHRLSAAPAVVTLTYLLALVVLAALMAIDLDVHRLPDVLTLPSYLVFGVLLAVDSFAVGRWRPYGYAWLCAGALFAAYFMLAFVGPPLMNLLGSPMPAGSSAIGFGDIKLAGVLGLLLGWLNWRLPLLATLGAFLIGGIVSIILLLARRATRTTQIAMGPSMVMAAVLLLCA